MSSEEILTIPAPPADVRLAYGGDKNQFADLRLPKKPGKNPVAVMIHGGFWRAQYDLLHAGHLCAALTNVGISTVNLEYRRVGNAGGGWPGSFQDVVAALRWLQQIGQKYSFDLARVIVMGHSAGGQLALVAVAQTFPFKLRGALALAPVADLRMAYDLHLSDDAVVEFLGGTPAQVPEHYREASPTDLKIGIAQRIVHCEQDEIVPAEMSRKYFELKKRQKENIALIEPRMGGHFDVIDPRSRVWSEVKDAALELIG